MKHLKEIPLPEQKYTFQMSQSMYRTINNNVSFIYINTVQIEKKGSTPWDLIDWLPETVNHIFLSHIHQGKCIILQILKLIISNIQTNIN
jgi:hypothetical protein